MQGETSYFPYIKNNLNPDTNCPRACPAPSTRLSPRSERTQKFHTFIALGTVDWNLRGSESQRRQKVNLETVGRGASAEPSRVLVASGQRIDVGIMEKCVVTVPPGEGLRREGRPVTIAPPPRLPCKLSLPPPASGIPWFGCGGGGKG